MPISMRYRRTIPRLFAALLAVACFEPMSYGAEVPVVSVDGGKLKYARDEQGNQLPDFSNCGYAGADRDLPDVPARVTVAPAEGDDTIRIQAAIDAVAALPKDESGFRGAVQLALGEFQIAGQLRIRTSGVVLRGAGSLENGTVLVATGTDRRPLIRLDGENDRHTRGETKHHTVDNYTPVGSRQLRLDSVDGLHVGDSTLVTRPSTAEWIKAIGTDAIGVAWKPGSRDIRWDRTVTAINDDTISIDAPITTAIDSQFGGATVEPYEWPGRIERIGVEDLRLRSAHDIANPLDEEHAWFGITVENARDAWIRRVEFRGFAGGAVALYETTTAITVEDCIAVDPVSELGGYRRHTFFTQGQLSLFLRCWAEHGRHDFAVGHCASGPNAFVNCFAANAHDSSGPIECWASGVLYDNVRIDGGGLDLENRWIVPPGAGWAAANCVLWQCRAATIHCFRPPTANNWAIGCWAGFSGDGTIQSRSDFVRPHSLYQAQLRERAGAAVAARVDPLLGEPSEATNPTVEKAAEFATASSQPARQLIDVIRDNMRRGSTNDRSGARNISAELDRAGQGTSPTRRVLTVQNGWLVADGKLVTGGRFGPTYWRGTLRPDEASAIGPNISRFVPGRVGTGFTDDLEQVANKMLVDGTAVYDHHYGLWYERRRDDHLMVREQDGNVAPPFYEQPFARSGIDTAWDGLSKYDLTKFNPWYWNRLHDFARLCDERGLVLFHQNYFQHNILEAGAHWSDSPWRPANNVNDTGLPEPPVYIGDKRQFMAPAFYDVSNPRLRALHRGYIRQCLDNFADTSNAIQMTSAEYTGPLEFVQFWLDTIIEWEQEHHREVLVAISAPKDVQDAILADPERSLHVDVIDIRYWAYTAGDDLYAPRGGLNLAPRQHLRQTKQKPGGAAAIVKAVREYRTRYPEKAVIYNANENCPSTSDGWGVLIGGGSIPDVKFPPQLAEIIPTLRLVDGVVSDQNAWCIGRDGRDYLIYSANASAPLSLNLPDIGHEYRAKWIDAKLGTVVEGGNVNEESLRQLPSRASVLWLTRDKKPDAQ